MYQHTLVSRSRDLEILQIPMKNHLFRQFIEFKKKIEILLF